MVRFPITRCALAGAAVCAVALNACGGGSPAPATTNVPPSSPSTPAQTVSTPAAPAPNAGALPAEEHLETSHAVMVTVELDYGNQPKTIAEAIKDVQRQYKASDGTTGRTFAILDAYGERNPDGKLHMSMHVSTEKPGNASLVWKKTGEVLWRASIEGAPVDLASRKLGIIIDDGKGHDMVVDGSNGPSSILDALIRDKHVPVRDVWPDGQEREVTFIYSACGCPVKAKVKRVGERTMRTEDTPVMFPDDPAALAVITGLMKW